MFEVRLIDAGNLRAAYAVMQLAAPALSLPEFRRMVGSSRLGGRSGAILGLFDRREYIHAIFRAQLDDPICGGKRLKITEFTHSDSISTSMLLAMVDGLEQWGRGVACDQMMIEAARGDRCHSLPLCDVLTTKGFSGQSMIMARRI